MTVARRIATNTLATYVKLFVFAITGFIAVPVALRTLGAVDYGIYSVIGGCLSFLMFLNYSLQTGAERHIAHALGEERSDEATKWLTTSLIVHAIAAATIATFAMVASGWVLHHLLVIPGSRMAVAEWIYRMVVFAMVCSIVSTPYQALLVAHEAIASMSLINAGSGVLLLVSVLCLPYLPGDALLWYGGMYCAFQSLVALGPATYSYVRFPEARIPRLTVDRLRERLKELFGFSGWTLLQVISILARVQGPAVVLNVFFGPIANAAYGLAVQVQSFASNIIWAFLGAATPPIVKRHASGDNIGMARLSDQVNAYGFGILWMAVGPVLFEAPLCLRLWLRDMPASTVAFVLPVLIALVIDQLTLGYNLSLVATGRLAGFSLAVSIANAIGIPVGYVLLRHGEPGTWLLWAVVAGAILAGVGRLKFAAKHATISVTRWANKVLMPSAICVGASLLLAVALRHSMAMGVLRLAIVAIGNCMIVALIMWFVASSADQRVRLRSMIRSIPDRLTRKPAIPVQTMEESLNRTVGLGG